MLQTLLRLPFYACGALVGFFIGYIYLVLQVIHIIPGLRWLENLIRYTLLQDTLSVYPKAEHEDEVASRPQSFAVMDAAALGNALYAMEAPAASRTSAPFTAAAAAGKTDHQTPIIDVPGTPDHHDLSNEISDLDLQQQQEEEEVLLDIQDRLSSFPLDRLSPTTTATATALSLATGLAPEGSLYDRDDDLDEHDDHDRGVPISEFGLPIEGEMDMTGQMMTNDDVSPLPDRIVTSDQFQQVAESPLKSGGNPTKGLLTSNLGPDHRSETTDLPNHQQEDVTRSKLDHSAISKIAQIPDQQQQQGPVPAAVLTARAPAKAAVYANAAAAASDAVGMSAPDTPRSVASSTQTGVSSIRTTDSVATAEKKKKKDGLFAALKKKALKGRQQLR